MRGARIRLTLVALAAAAVLAALPTTALAVKTIGLSSGTFRFEVNAGESIKGQVFLTNDGDEDVKVLVYSADQEVDERGGIEYKVPTRADITQFDRPSSWIGVTMPKDSKSLGNVPYLVLKPGDRVPINFTIQVPGSAPPGDHNLLVFFEMFEQQQQSDGAQTIVSGRLGTRVTMRVKGEVVERLTLRPFSVPTFVIGSEAPFTARINNEGNIDSRVTVSAFLRNRNGSDLNSAVPLKSRTVFARESLEATGLLVADRMPVGPMTVALEVVPVDEDGQPLASGRDTILEERQVWFIPLWLLIVIVVIVVLLAARIIWAFAVKSARRSQRAPRRGRRSRASEPSDSAEPQQPEAVQ